MNMIKIKNIIIIAILAFTASCSDWLDVSPKEENVDERVVLNSEAAFRNAVNGIYTELREFDLYGGNMNLAAVEFMGQNFVTEDDFSPSSFSKLDYESTYSKSVISAIWSKMYRTIYNCNNLIKLFEDKSDINFLPGAKECLIAELHGLRAMMHFDLLRLFHPSYSENANYSEIAYMESINQEPLSLTSEEIVLKVLNDLQIAQDLAQGVDPIQTGKDIDSESSLFGMDVRSRQWKFNYYAILALKARVYLYKGDVPKAAEYAEAILKDVHTESMVISSLWDTPDSKDKAFSTEHIFGLASSQTKGIREQSEYVFNENDVLVNQRIIDWFGLANNVTDIRKPTWFSNKNMNNKFGSASSVCSGGVAIVHQRVPIFKVSEIYLIAAEALAVSNFDKAKFYMSYYKLRRLGIDVSNLINDSETILKMVGDEYAIDFLGEGQLFFYFKRKNMSVINSHIFGETIDMDSSKYSFPIPQGGMR